MIRKMTVEDYDGVRALWMTIRGFAIRSLDDSREGVARFLERNPAASVVAVEEGRIVAEGDVCIMCAWRRNTACGESERPWWYFAWRR